MERIDFTRYDELPEDMLNYLKHYGPHFNKKLCKFAVSNMYKGNEEYITPYTKEQVNTLLESGNIKIKHNQLHDAVFVANMCKADYLGSSIPDEQHLALYIKDVLDDADGYDGIAFNRWYADTARLGIAIDWEEML